MNEHDTTTPPSYSKTGSAYSLTSFRTN